MNRLEGEAAGKGYWKCQGKFFDHEFHRKGIRGIRGYFYLADPCRKTGKLAIVIMEKIFSVFSVQNSVAKNLCSCEKDLT